MAAAMNGMALHGGVIPYSGTFLVFSDYCRPAIRLAALMGERVIHVMTHDSIGLGEDGPTHQPVEHLAALRAIPNLLVFRPVRRGRDASSAGSSRSKRTTPERAGADAAEPAAAAPRASTTQNRCAEGAYEIVPRPTGRAGLAVRHRLGSRDRGRGAQAAAPSAACRARRLGAVLRAVRWRCRSAERAAPSSATRRSRSRSRPAVRQGWDAIIGADGAFVGMTGFGASAPYKDLYKHFGITPEAVAEAALSKLGEVNASQIQSVMAGNARHPRLCTNRECRGHPAGA